MYLNFKSYVENQLKDIEKSGLYKKEERILSPQDAMVKTDNGQLLNLCANNYLGLSQNIEIREAAKKGLEDWGYGMASVRFICGTQEIHKILEEKISKFLKMEDTILYPSCFDANGGLFETLLTSEDAIISDQLVHASIIDGIRLCKAKRYRYSNNNMDELEAKLQQADKEGARYKLISTDGVFSMDGHIAQLDKICDLAEKYQALLHYDDCHGIGVIGETGRGTHEYHQCMDRIDIITGTLGKALGGASGGFTSSKFEIVELLRQKSRPYLFSNTVAPSLVVGAMKAIEILGRSDELLIKLRKNTLVFRQGIESMGLETLPGEHPIVPIMLFDEKLAVKFSNELFNLGVYAVAFSYPVVPKNTARIRTQMSAALTDYDITFALERFETVKKMLNI